ncbi:uncharacterized protein EI97DRAFT_430320 [Westerdykella ornata]|uniref:F-box domain-containing protein n=1 Tax=Westerdykella ornata TaxID=318751 RepID=A0A6A6JSI6_WESOR|nr:uncharacterized protein EI97DRAFT_430320 [Westerdykella ornata]KAF2279225.1 hypothetical protein EI97DRAFT_430320 [Westerdykella ornata]
MEVDHASVRPPRSSLLELPIELVQRIVTFLPPSSAASFTLSCPGSLNVLGNDSWCALMHDASECAELLSILNCTCLENLEPTNSTHEPGPTEHPEPVVCTPLYSRFGYVVEWLHVVVRYVLDRHADREIGDILLDEYTDVIYRNLRFRDPDSNTETEKCVLVAIAPRIVAGYLLLRCTYTVLFPPEDGNVHFSSLLNSDLDICKHVSATRRREPWYDMGFVDRLILRRDYRKHYGSSAYESDLESDIDIEDLDDPPPRTNISLHQCSFCCTEYEARIERGEDEASTSIIVTSWHNLGEITLLSGCGFSPLWKTFLGVGKPHDVRVLSYPLGSVRNVFEVWDGSQLGDVRRKPN